MGGRETASLVLPSHAYTACTQSPESHFSFGKPHHPRGDRYCATEHRAFPRPRIMPRFAIRDKAAHYATRRDSDDTNEFDNPDNSYISVESVSTRMGGGLSIARDGLRSTENSGTSCTRQRSDLPNRLRKNC